MSVADIALKLARVGIESVIIDGLSRLIDGYAVFQAAEHQDCLRLRVALKSTNAVYPMTYWSSK